MNASPDITGLTRRRWDAIVIGAGPAGVIAAHDLARRGRSVLLVDRARFPRDKVCGGCLNLRALASLQASGLEPAVWSRGAVSLRGFVMGARGCTARVALPGGAAVSRTALDQALATAARDAGAFFLDGVHASVSSMHDGCVRVRLRTRDAESELDTRACLLASGLASLAANGPAGVRIRVAPGARVGAGTCITCPVNEYQPGLIYMAVSRHGYVGAVRVENDQLNVAAAFDQRFLRECGGPAAAARHVFDEAGLPRVPELDAAHWRGTPPLTRRARPVAQHRLILIGDAAGYVEPFTGEGMAWALDSGRAAARHVHQSIEQWDRAASIAWENGYARTFAAAQRRCAIVSRAIRHPLIPYIGVRALRVLPALARPIVHSLNVSDREEVGA